MQQARGSPSRDLYDVNKDARVNNSYKLIESRTVMDRQASILDEKRIVLFKKGRQMGGSFYIVEISSNNS
jgi:hypothetical protein